MSFFFTFLYPDAPGRMMRYCVCESCCYVLKEGKKGKKEEDRIEINPIKLGEKPTSCTGVKCNTRRHSGKSINRKIFIYYLLSYLSIPGRRFSDVEKLRCSFLKILFGQKNFPFFFFSWRGWGE